MYQERMCNMKKYRRLICILTILFLLAGYAPVVYAKEEETDEDKTRSPYFYVESEDVG